MMAHTIARTMNRRQLLTGVVGGALGTLVLPHRAAAQLAGSTALTDRLSLVTTGGTKEGAFMSVVPWLEMGWNVVNVEYRLARISPAPAAVEDCLCALKWVVSHAGEYHIDASKIVVSGDSAGWHLSVCFCAGLQVSVNEGSSQDKRLAIPVFPPER